MKKKIIDEETVRLRKEKKKLDELMSADEPRPWWNSKEARWEIEY
jgi:hypothetical protein